MNGITIRCTSEMKFDVVSRLSGRIETKIELQREKDSRQRSPTDFLGYLEIRDRNIEQVLEMMLEDLVHTVEIA